MDDIVYAVEWVEIEFGQRAQGYKIFLDIETCVKHTKSDSEIGPYNNSYYGPSRLLGYYEVPWRCLAPQIQRTLRKKVNKGIKEIFAFTENNWKPHIKSGLIYIN